MSRLLAASLLVVLLHMTDGSDSNAAASNRRFTYGDGTYEISSFRTDWHSARNYCKTQGGQLISIETSGENSAVMAATAAYPMESIWTSGCEMYRDGNFYWDSTGASLSFTYWANNNPINGNGEYCLELDHNVNHMWGDYTCDSEQLFICEYHPCTKETSLTGQKNEKAATSRFSYGSSTYYVFNSMVNWVEAKNNCKISGMQLVSIESEGENSAIMDEIWSMRPTSFWISGSDLGHEGKFYWEGTGATLGPYHHFGNGEEPNNDKGREHCVLFRGDLEYWWNDADCSTQCGYICELDESIC